MLGLLVAICLVHYCSGFAAPEVTYVALLDSPIYPKGEDGCKIMDTSKATVERMSESEAVMYGEMVFLEGLGESTIMGISVLKEASGKMEMVFNHELCDFCEEVKMKDGSDYHSFLQFFDFPECPIIPGSYPIHNFTLDSNQFNLKSQHTGRYLAVLTMYEKTGESCQNDRVNVCDLAMDIIVEATESKK